VLLWIPNLQPNPRTFPRVRPNPRFFAAVSGSFWLSVRESIFTYQVAVFKQCCITQRLPAAVIVLSAAIVDRKGGGGQWHYDHWSGAQRVAPRCRPVIGKGSAHRGITGPAEHFLGTP